MSNFSGFNASGFDLIPTGSGGGPAAGPFTSVAPADPPAGISADINALYRGLLPFEWKGIGLPYTKMTMDLRQDLVIHKFVDRDGAHVEGTGRHPLQFDFIIPFINTLGSSRGSETWSQPLYPTTWRKFILACSSGSTGPLQHPELGPLTCKFEHAKTTWEGGARGGPTVEASWVETDDTSTQLLTALGQPSPISALASATANMDSYLGAISPVVAPVPPKFVQSFTDLMQQLQGLGTQASLLSYSVGGQLNAIVYQANLLEASLSSGPNAPNALNWPIFQAAEQAKDAAYALQGNLLTTGQSVQSYTTSKESTLAEIAMTLNADLYLLMNLNPQLLSVQPVPRDTLVRYYAT